MMIATITIATMSAPQMVLAARCPLLMSITPIGRTAGAYGGGDGVADIAGAAGVTGDAADEGAGPDAGVVNVSAGAGCGGRGGMIGAVRGSSASTGAFIATADVAGAANASPGGGAAAGTVSAIAAAGAVTAGVYAASALARREKK